MIFGRKKKQKLAEEDILDENEMLEDEDLDDAEIDDDEDLEDEVEDDTDEDADEDDADQDDAVEDDADEGEDSEDEQLADNDLREDGPFDLTEVDLDADEIERMDFGSIILTPFENMQIQLQVDQATNQVRIRAISRERWVTIIEKVFQMMKPPTNSATPAKIMNRTFTIFSSSFTAAAFSSDTA